MQAHDDLLNAVRSAMRNDDFLTCLSEFFMRVDKLVASHNPRCLGGGTCCRFDVMDHRLYVTTGELALLLTNRPHDILRCSKKRCPYQSANKCLARERRPLGCRMFFCDESTEKWALDAYEKFHTELKDLHKKFGVEYFYSELTLAISDLCQDIFPDNVTS